MDYMLVPAELLVDNYLNIEVYEKDVHILLRILKLAAANTMVDELQS